MLTFKEYLKLGNKIITDSTQASFSTFLTTTGQIIINDYYDIEYGDKKMYIETQAEVEKYVNYILRKNELYFTKMNNVLTQNISLNYSKLIDIVNNITENSTDKKDETTTTNQDSTTTNNLTNTNDLTNTTNISNTTVNTGTVGVATTETPGATESMSQKAFDSVDFVESTKNTSGGTNASNATTTNNLNNVITALNTITDTGTTTNTGTIGILADITNSLITDNLLTKIGNSTSTTTESDINTILSNMTEYINIYNYNLWNSIIKEINTVITDRIWDYEDSDYLII